jgi:hypothetical protein
LVATHMNTLGVVARSAGQVAWLAPSVILKEFVLRCQYGILLLLSIVTWRYAIMFHGHGAHGNGNKLASFLISLH